MDMSSVCEMSGLLMTVAKQLSEYRLGLVGIQEVIRDRGGTKPSGEYTFSTGKGNVSH
jgi:hypothetical protein